jgi:hypothetical protein
LKRRRGGQAIGLPVQVDRALAQQHDAVDEVQPLAAIARGCLHGAVRNLVPGDHDVAVLILAGQRDSAAMRDRAMLRGIDRQFTHDQGDRVGQGARNRHVAPPGGRHRAERTAKGQDQRIDQFDQAARHFQAGEQGLGAAHRNQAFGHLPGKGIVVRVATGKAADQAGNHRIGVAQPMVQLARGGFQHLAGQFRISHVARHGQIADQLAVSSRSAGHATSHQRRCPWPWGNGHETAIHRRPGPWQSRWRYAAGFFGPERVPALAQHGRPDHPPPWRRGRWDSCRQRCHPD